MLESSLYLPDNVMIGDAVADVDEDDVDDDEAAAGAVLFSLEMLELEELVFDPAEDVSTSMTDCVVCPTLVSLISFLKFPTFYCSADCGGECCDNTPHHL